MARKPQPPLDIPGADDTILAVSATDEGHTTAHQPRRQSLQPDAQTIDAGAERVQVESVPFSLRKREGAWRDALLRRMLAVADVGAAVAASVSLGIAGSANHALWSALLAPVWLVIAKIAGLYDRDQRSLRHLTIDELPRIFTWALAGTIALVLLLSLTPGGALSTREAVQMAICAGVADLLLRGTARSLWRQITPPERAIVIGDGALSAAVRRKLELFPDIHLAVVGALPALQVDDLRESPEILADADRILLATARLDEPLIAELTAYCRARKVKLSVVPPARGIFGTAVELSHVADLPVVEYNTWDVSRSTQLLKRALDLAVAATALVALSPLMLAIGVLVLLDGGRPALFVQTRVGQSEQPFRMLKFRTMVPNAEELLPQLVTIDELSEPVFKLVDDPRVTFIGRLLRRTSLDELPQLLNVLLGHMSLVGPRPEQIEIVERYTDEHRLRLAVKPGLTGPMQVYGRGRLTLEERLALERDYIENISIGRDLRILALTVTSVLHGRGAF